jgi:hypothetical protein
LIKFNQKPNTKYYLKEHNLLTTRLLIILKDQLK